MDALMEETEARIHDIESKYGFLKNAMPAAAMAMMVMDVPQVQAKDVKDKQKSKQFE
jgi:hypothetical protein